MKKTKSKTFTPDELSALRTEVYDEQLCADGPRKTFRMDDPPITPETYERLLVALEAVYPGKWRRTVDVMPVAVCKTIDNERDALETIRRIEERHLAQGAKK